MVSQLANQQKRNSSNIVNRKLISIAVCGLLLPAAYAKNRKISEDLDTTKSGSVDVIVQFTSKPDSKFHDKVVKRELGAAKAGLYSMTPAALEDLANDPEVTHISPDRPVQSTLETVRPSVFADVAQQYGWTGAGIGVAVIDSGVSSAPDLIKPIVYSKSFNSSNADEMYGHGTHVAGIIAGVSKSTKGMQGLANGAHIINLRVLNDKGAGTDSAVIAAIQEAIRLKTAYNIRVINLSLGRPARESYKTDPLCQAVEQAWKAGIVVVVAAGNNGRDNSRGTNGYGTINSPANDPYVITVGAIKMMGTTSRVDDQIASYSSKGPTSLDFIVKPDLVAPGNQIVSVGTKGTGFLETISPFNIVNTNYFRLSGTSMAAPMVSGAVALMLQKDPNLTPDLVKARLMRSASKVSMFPLNGTGTDPVLGTVYQTRHDLFTVGAGYLNIWAALNDNSTAAPGKPALSPKAVRNSTTGAVTVTSAL